MLKKIGLAVVGLVLAFVGFAATRPDTFHVERTASVKAPPDVVFALTEDMHAWATWNPWREYDLTLTEEFSGPERGVGASYKWAGNDKVGTGTMAVAETKPGEMVRYDLHFMTPFEAKNAVTVTMKPAADGSQVTWAMDGTNNFVSKAMSVFMDMDKMVGPDFERGLANLDKRAQEKLQLQAAEQAAAEAKAAADKAAAEAAAAKDAAPVPAEEAKAKG